MRAAVLASFAVLVSMSVPTSAEVWFCFMLPAACGVLTDIANRFEIASGSRVQAKFN
jgi:hypothetical protein